MDCNNGYRMMLISIQHSSGTGSDTRCCAFTLLLLLNMFRDTNGGGTCMQASGIPGKQLTCLEVSPQYIDTSLGAATTNVSIGYYSDLEEYSFCSLVFRWFNGTTSSQDFDLPFGNGTFLWGIVKKIVAPLRCTK